MLYHLFIPSYSECCGPFVYSISRTGHTIGLFGYIIDVVVAPGFCGVFAGLKSCIYVSIPTVSWHSPVIYAYVLRYI